MTENTERQFHAGDFPESLDRPHVLTINASFGKGSLDVYELYLERPNVAVDGLEIAMEKMKERYGIDVQSVIDKTLRSMAQSMGYKGVGFQCDPQKDHYGELLDGGHEAMQQKVNEYKVGIKATKEKAMGMRAKAAQFDTLAETLVKKGLALADVIEAMKDGADGLKELME